MGATLPSGEARGHAACELRQRIHAERKRGDEEPERVDREVGEPEPHPRDEQREHDAQRRGSDPMRGVNACAAAGGATSSANTSSAPVIWLVAATARPRISRKPSDERAHRHATGMRHRLGSSEASSNGRPTSASAASTTTATIEQRQNLVWVDPQERAEQQRFELLEHAAVEAQEQVAKRQRARLARLRSRPTPARAATGARRSPPARRS